MMRINLMSPIAIAVVQKMVDDVQADDRPDMKFAVADELLGDRICATCGDQTMVLPTVGNLVVAKTECECGGTLFPTVLPFKELCVMRNI